MKLEKLSGSKCKRVVFKAKGRVAIEDYALEKPEASQVLVETACTLISPGTETAFLMALSNTPGTFPMYPGYSNAGVIADLGETISRFKIGDKVVSRGNHVSHILANENELIRISEGLSFDEASFFALGSIVLQGIRKANIELGESVVVLGLGLVGNLALQLAKLSGGMPVVGVDAYDYRLGISQRCGADNVLNLTQVDLEDSVKHATNGKGADIVIEASGNPQAITTALQLVGRYGRVIILGSPRGTTEVNFYSVVHKKGVSIIGAHETARPIYESSHGWRTERDDSALTMRLIAKGLLKVNDLVTAKLSYLYAEEAYRRLIESKDRFLGIILDWRAPEHYLLPDGSHDVTEGVKKCNASDSNRK